MALRLASVDSTTFLFGNNVLNALLGWLIGKDTVAPVSFWGAVGNGTTDDTAAIQAAIASGRPLDWGDSTKNYRLTTGISQVLNRDLAWYSSGAKITVDSTASIQRAVYIDTNGYNVSIDGALTLDCARKAFTGWYFVSNSATRANFNAKSLGVRNVYRASTAMIGGDGIWIRGGYENIYLDRPDVRMVSMAAGAGIATSQGVAGITITAAGTGMSPGEITILHPYVNGVFSEDSSYLMDQDGIRIFTEDDNGGIMLFDTHFNVRGGLIKNCHGRSIKSQAEFGSIDGTKFVRNREIAQMAFQGSMPEIDFQVGGGLISNIEIRYESATPLRVLQWSGTRQSGGKYSTGLSVSGLKMSVTGGTSAPLGSFIVAQMYEQARAAINLTNIEYVNIGTPIAGNFMEARGLTTQKLDVRMVNVTAPIATTVSATPAGYVFYRPADALVVALRVVNFTNTRPQSSTVSGSATAGSLTATTFGLDNVA